MHYNKIVGSVNIKLDTKRMDENLRNAQNVLDGGIDPFINAYLTWISTGKKEE